jgi:hypothetical protein
VWKVVDPSDLLWRKSAHSIHNNCVEIAFSTGEVFVRSSNDPRGPVLTFSAAEWSAFVQAVRDGDFDVVKHL